LAHERHAELSFFDTENDSICREASLSCGGLSRYNAPRAISEAAFAQLSHFKKFFSK